MKSKHHIGQMAKADWVTGLVTIVILLVLNFGTTIFDALDRWEFDKVLLSLDKEPAPEILVVEIDNKSYAKIGRSIFLRDVHAKVIDILTAADVGMIVHTELFNQPIEGHLSWIRSRLTAAERNAPMQTVHVLRALRHLAERDLDNDKTLADSIKHSGKVILAARPAWNNHRYDNEKNGIKSYALPFFEKDNTHFNAAINGVEMPIEKLTNSAMSVGALVGIPDGDGITRKAPLLTNMGGMSMPSIAFVAASNFVNTDWRNFHTLADGYVKIGDRLIETDPTTMYWPMRYKHRGQSLPFESISFVDVLDEKINPKHLRGRLVVIGATGSWLTGRNDLAADANTLPAPVEGVAREISSLLKGHTTVIPTWAWALNAVLLVMLAAYLLMVVPRIAGKHAIAITTTLVVLIMAAQYGALALGLWVPVMLPVVILVVTHVVLTSKRFLVAEAGKQVSDADASESHREVAIALQGQGQLDAAYDRFRRVIFNEALVANLKGLALDFERKRHYGKAQAVHEYILEGDSEDKHSRGEIARLKALANAILVPGMDATRSMVQSETGIQMANPTLGRYELTKELGRGAMGVVYLGIDPRIGRRVAIKTMALNAEYDGQDLVDAKERFYREAKTAGRLQHPNIVTIHDVGEEQGLAYIAMEVLSGQPLDAYLRSKGTLPVVEAVEIATVIADALAYAHLEGVVHRDIKPANIIFETKQVLKITDFGIARITDSSKTKTGVVMGTPAYMAPEQISGLEIDGRVDLYALGVMAYQLITGCLPYEGESIHDLVYKIVNGPVPRASVLRPDIPPSLDDVLVKAMAKDAADRFSTGTEFSRALRAAMN